MNIQIENVNNGLFQIVNHQINKFSYTELDRKVKEYSGLKTTSKKINDTDFRKKINFNLDEITNVDIPIDLNNLYLIIKKEAQRFIEDKYLDINETKDLFSMMLEFSKKTEECIESTNCVLTKDHIKFIFEKTVWLIEDILKTSIKGCKHKAKEYIEISQNVDSFEKKKYFKNYIFWNRKIFSKKTPNGIAYLINTIEFITGIFLISKPILAICAIFSFKKEEEKIESAKSAFRSLSIIEEKRAKRFEEILNS